MSSRYENIRIHPSAMIEDGVQIGAGTSIWDHVHVRQNARIGRQCNIGGKSLIAYDVEIGDMVKIGSAVHVCYGVKVERGVMIGTGVVFTNDHYPRATNPELTEPSPAEPNQNTLLTHVREGATIGAGSVIGCDLEIGRFAMVGLGSVVTRSVPDFHLVAGNPAHSQGVVCRCGQLLHRFDDGDIETDAAVSCTGCRREYSIDRSRAVSEMEFAEKSGANA